MMSLNHSGILAGLASCVILAVGGATAAEVTLANLRCEYLVNPVGIDATRPRLSWNLQPGEPGRRGMRQTAYRVLVASSAERLAENRGDLWDSGKVASDLMVGVEYGGKPLASGSRCWWKVMVWDQRGQASPWSAPAFWTLGLLHIDDWQAKWIGEPLTEPLTAENLGYRSQDAKSKDALKWVQIDLGASRRIDAVRLWGAWPATVKSPPGDGFPLRFKIEATENIDLSDAVTLVDRTDQDVPNPGVKPLLLRFEPRRARYVRLTATKLGGPWTAMNCWDAESESWKPKLVANRPGKLALAEMEVLSNERNIALGQPVEALDAVDAVTVPNLGVVPGWSKAALTDGQTESDVGSAYHHRPATLVRREFDARKAVRQATLYATAQGCYELYINGFRVGDQQLAPGWTIYDKRVLVQTYDVSQLLQRGVNVIGVVLGDGWFRMTREIWDNFDSMKRFSGYRSYPGCESRWLLAQLEITYEDGSQQTIGTDRSWLCHGDGPLRRSSMYSGVLYDARKEITGWEQPMLKTGGEWRPAVERPIATGPRLSAQMMEPIRVLEELKPLKRMESQAGRYVYDFGKIIAGVCRIKVDGPAGATITLRYAEALKPDGTIYLANLGGNYSNRDTFILAGHGPQSFIPSFTYHGFRYVEVSGVPSAEAIAEIVALALGSDVPRAGTFASSDPRLNRLCAIVDQAYRSNMPSLTVDCVGRDERKPWMGDCFTDELQSLAYLYDFAAFGANQHQVIVDATGTDGVCPPFVRNANPGTMDASACWSDASVNTPHGLWLNYADRRSLECGYATAKVLMDTIAESNPDFVPRKKYRGDFGDWLSSRQTIPPGATDWEAKGGKGAPADLFAAAWWARSASQTAKMAAALGRADESDRYAAMAEKILAALVENHVKPDGSVGNGEQSCYALTLGMGHLGGEIAAKATDQFLRSIVAYQEHLATGSNTTIFLLSFLADHGQQDLAYRMVMQPTCPSYGFMVDCGATAMWERLDGWHPRLGFNPAAMNDFNHLGLNSVYEWIIGCAAGIRPDFDHPGYRHFFITPKLGGGLTWMKAAYDSISGRIESSYQLKDGHIALTVLVPPNTRATIGVPAADVEAVTESDQPASQAEGVKFLREENGVAMFEVQSGCYHFGARWK
jgi:alpha-L-rhamnosidase